MRVCLHITDLWNHLLRGHTDSTNTTTSIKMPAMRSALCCRIIINGLHAINAMNCVGMTMFNLLSNKTNLSARITLIVVFINILPIKCFTNRLNIFLHAFVRQKSKCASDTFKNTRCGRSQTRCGRSETGSQTAQEATSSARTRSTSSSAAPTKYVTQRTQRTNTANRLAQS